MTTTDTDTTDTDTFPPQWWGPVPEPTAIMGWSARAIQEVYDQPALTPTGRTKTRNGRPMTERALRAVLLRDRQGSFGPKNLRPALALMVNNTVMPWVNATLAGALGGSRVSVELGEGVTAVYTATGGYVYITVNVADDDGWVGQKWSGAASGFARPPEPGTRVEGRGGFGVGTVLRRAVRDGYTGVVVLLDKRPDWHVEQNPHRCAVLLFGAEIKTEVRS